MDDLDDYLDEGGEPSIDLDTLDRLTAMEFDKGMEAFMREQGFGDNELVYEEIDGERQLMFRGKRIMDFIKSHKRLMRKKFDELELASMRRALKLGEEIIELQKLGGKQ
jgi:hypothetical protein